MENKYYQPDITDLRVGYECEIVKPDYSSTGPIMDYEPIIIGKYYDENEGLRTRKTATLPDPVLLRTPYLTREQIEAEGWKHTWTFDRYATYDGKYETSMEFEWKDVWQMGGAFLKYYPESHKVKIITVGEGFTTDGPENSVKYEGLCYSVNEFRYICKLLNIK